MITRVQQKYDDAQLWELRQQGWILQELGNLIGITKEGMRQRLKRAYGSTKITRLLTKGEAARKLGVSGARLTLLEKKGGIKPIKRSPRLICYTPKQVLQIYKLLYNRKCPFCESTIPINHIKLCEDCSSKQKRNPYFFMTSEAKNKHIECCRRWQANHKALVGATSEKS